MDVRGKAEVRGLRRIDDPHFIAVGGENRQRKQYGSGYLQMTVFS
jgi:hypothetical protein